MIASPFSRANFNFTALAPAKYPDYLDRRDGVPAFEQVALYTFDNLNLADDGPPERVVGLSATASLFPLLGIEPALGRFFDDSEAQPGADAVVMLSHSLWQRRFGSREDIVDRTIRLNGEPVRVVGIMPQAFQFPNSDVALWRPFPFTPEQMADDARGNEFSFMIARLAPGAAVEQAQEQVDAIHEANKERFPQVREFWESSGFVLWMKRLERERFHWPRAATPTVTLSGQELNWLLDGFDLSKWRPHQRLEYQWVA